MPVRMPLCQIGYEPHDQHRSRHYRRQRRLRHRGAGKCALGTRATARGASRPTRCCSAGFAGVDMVFLPRHGRGHVHSPTSINYRANIDALKRAGVTDVISRLRLRLVPRGTAARHLRDRRPVHRPHPCAREELLRPRIRRACLAGASGLLRSSPTRWTRPAREEGIPPCQRRHLSRDGRPAILVARRIRTLPLVGLRRDRHDRDARSQARARGGAALRDRRDGDRLRLLASRSRSRHRRSGDQGADRATPRTRAASSRAWRRSSGRSASRRRSASNMCSTRRSSPRPKNAIRNCSPNSMRSPAAC